MWSRLQRPSAIAELKRDRDLVRLYWPVELRPAFDALLEIDDALAAVVARATEPALAAIKLAWWHERLEQLDEGIIPAVPRLGAVAAELLPRGVGGADLAKLTESWASLLDEQPEAERIGEGGAKLFAMGAKLLGATDPLIEPAGQLYGYVNAARRGLMAMDSPADDLFPAVDGPFPETTQAADGAGSACSPRREAAAARRAGGHTGTVVGASTASADRENLT